MIEVYLILDLEIKKIIRILYLLKVTLQGIESILFNCRLISRLLLGLKKHVVKLLQFFEMQWCVPFIDDVLFYKNSKTNMEN